MHDEDHQGEDHQDDLFDRILEIHAWLDANAPEQTDRERRLLRILKISEEVGEVSEAVHGALAANPRKGASHTWDDVEKELCDVIVTGLVALCTVSSDPEKALDGRLRQLLDRLRPKGGEAAA
ncbi:MazG-like family protein [Streptomyces lichenis]|uniref:MazG-like family protein n=1 Tax=Streptomyces lichenis TaxID=2306967 RepID=A0ABT0I9H3_9ACTN|nr:MazG-like family protein [Streptomyces lichenis]MCK8677981.1 MazG-like family protein [Streptomyces lichenis]